MHCAADWASLWRENANGDDVCKLAGCWRLEEWLPPLVRNLKRSRAQGGSSASDAEPVQVVQHAVTLKKITDIYGHRYCNPTLFDPLDPRRRAPVEKTALEYLIYGNFKSDNVANDPGLPDQRWMSLDDVLDAVGRRSAVALSVGGALRSFLCIAEGDRVWAEMFGCCCSDKADSSQVQFNPTDEKTGYSNHAQSFGYEGSPQPTMSPGRGLGTRLSPSPETKIPLPADADQANQGGGKDKDKAEEKARLQELVKSFAKRATKGIECHFLNPETRKLSPARYFLEKDLRELCVKGEGMPDVTCPIAQVTDILRVEEDTSFLPSAVVEMLSEMQRKNLLVIQQRDRQLLLVESSTADADTFFTSMRVLRLYCQQQDYVRANGGGP